MSWYYFRLPWFARVVGVDKVSINGDSQTIVEQEISYAAQASVVAGETPIKTMRHSSIRLTITP